MEVLIFRCSNASESFTHLDFHPTSTGRKERTASPVGTAGQHHGRKWPVQRPPGLRPTCGSGYSRPPENVS